MHFAENMLEHFRVAEVKGFKLGKAELGKNIPGGISAGDYPVDIPYILFRISIRGAFSAGYGIWRYHVVWEWLYSQR